ncbi:hypothetical protein PM082_014343 [Marasmius tenuissimus]|nr:hypothetical protein PM082_014343 [Marasmius tenuissimus]
MYFPSDEAIFEDLDDRPFRILASRRLPSGSAYERSLSQTANIRHGMTWGKGSRVLSESSESEHGIFVTGGSSASNWEL